MLEILFAIFQRCIKENLKVHFPVFSKEHELHENGEQRSFVFYLCRLSFGQSVDSSEPLGSWVGLVMARFSGDSLQFFAIKCLPPSNKMIFMVSVCYAKTMRKLLN